MNLKGNIEKLARWFKEAYTANPVMFVIFILAVCTQGPLMAAITVWTGRLVDTAPSYLAGTLPIEVLLRISFTILALGLVVSGGSFAETFAVGRLQDSLIHNIKSRLLHASLETDYLTFLSSEKQNRLVRLTQGFDAHLTFLLQETVSSLGTMWTIVSFLIVIGLSSGWFVALVGLVVFIPVTIVNMRLAHNEVMYYRHASFDYRRVRYTEKLLTDTESAKEVALFDLTGHLMDKWETTYRALKNTRSRLEISQHNWKAYSEMLATVISGGLLILIIGQGNITPGVFLVTLTALISIQGGFFSISKSTSDLVSNLDKLEEIDTFLNEVKPHRSVPQNQKKNYVPHMPGSPVTIEVVDLSFSYDGDESYVLEGINLEIPPGKQVALVGENGAGKSTLIHLIMGLHRPTKGEVLLNGVRSDDLDPETRHQIITGVFQTFGRYHGLTLRENITLSSFEKTEMQLSPYLEKTGLLSSLGDKLDLIVGKEFDGIELSGGEWQRVALARAMVLKSPLVMLDEPTASLDPLAEAGLFKRFMETLHDRTVVVATHRLGSIRSVDEIIVLREGRVIERGNHNCLVQYRGHYWQMFEAQAAWYRD